MRANQARYRIATMARVLGVSPSGFPAWRAREPSRRRQDDEALKARIGPIDQRSRGTCGAPRIHAELAADGVRVGRKRVARRMRQMGLAGVSRRKGTRTTRRNAAARPAPDLVERRFEADAPDRLWVADITYVPTWAGFSAPGHLRVHRRVVSPAPAPFPPRLPIPRPLREELPIRRLSAKR